ncbi:HD domain-containing protein [Opitutaceae bacterium]|nr:HD domain-containing protein [Opitutaceae bacterium]MDB4473390.1 HD domain-containing protein [Opitutaceae bacterium]
MPTFPDVDTRDASAVSARIREHLLSINPDGDLSLFDKTFDLIGEMFRGNVGDFRAIDLEYHDYQHTLQASLCMAELLVGRHQANATPPFTWRQCMLGMAAVLMHDCGYLKTAADGDGTGAKFTYTHVIRSAATAASLLPQYGLNVAEKDVVVNAIRCTGPRSEISRLPFLCEADELVGMCVTTADYLGQMAAEDYPAELEILYHELEESDDYVNTPRDQRVFSSASDLIRKSPGFWRHFVLPKLTNEFRGVYRYLAVPYPHGENPYIDAIERNMDTINQRIAKLAPEPIES